MTKDDATVRGEMVALQIAVRALMQRLYEVDPQASSELRGKITKEVQGLPSHDVRAAALNFCIKTLFVTD